MNEADVSRASRIIGIISSEKSMTARDKIITMGTMIVITTVITAGNYCSYHTSHCLVVHTVSVMEW